MPSENKIAIVIVVYNISSLIAKQVECIKRFCKDSYDIIIIDNSYIPDIFKAVEAYSKEAGIRYIKTFAADKNGSESHVFACNMSYSKLKDEYEYFLYLDHDIFPVREFSITEILKDKVMAGLGQEKSKLYYWPGCVMWNNTKIADGLIDFSISREFKLDTGGNLYKAIESVGKENCTFFNEAYCANPYFRTGMYNFYATINDKMFMHFINSSGWNPTDDNEERINSLINVLNELLSNNNV